MLCSAVAAASLGAQTAQKRVGRVADMPDLPAPLELRDWKQVARDFDSLAFDPRASGQYLPLLQRDSRRLNFLVDTCFLPSYVGDGRMQPGSEEAITTMAALLGASLVGIEHTSPDDANWVRGQLQYYNPVAGLLLNNPSRGSYAGSSFWYELFPAILFSGLVWRFPAEATRQVAMAGGGATSMRDVMRAVAGRYRDAAERMGAKGGAGFDFTSFDFPAMRPVSNGQWREPDGAAGIAWLQYAAWREFGDPRFLEAADWCLRWLGAAEANPFYEVLLPFGALAAARMNAEEGTSYDVSRLVDWCFGPSEARPGWGVIAERWGDCDAHGLVGSITDGGGYAFAMNTFDMAAALVPLVRYDPRFARDIGKWMRERRTSALLSRKSDI